MEFFEKKKLLTQVIWIARGSYNFWVTSPWPVPHFLTMYASVAGYLSIPSSHNDMDAAADANACPSTHESYKWLLCLRNTMQDAIIDTWPEHKREGKKTSLKVSFPGRPHLLTYLQPLLYQFLAGQESFSFHRSSPTYKMGHSHTYELASLCNQLLIMEQCKGNGLPKTSTNSQGHPLFMHPTCRRTQWICYGL